MKINQTKAKGVIEVQLNRSLTIDNTEFFEEKLFTAVNQPTDKIVLNFKWVDSIDCAGTRILLKFLQKIESLGIELELINLNSSYVKTFFQVAGLADELRKRDSVQVCASLEKV